MPFKVGCKLTAFMGDPDRFPCHFGYEIGDEFIYDGENFIGRVCPGVLSSMVQVITAIRFAGNKFSERILFRYSGPNKRDPSMKKYDGVGWAPLKGPPEGADQKYVNALWGLSVRARTEKQSGWSFVCGDCRTSALFRVEPIGLADKGYDVPYYTREMSILEKIKADPGIGVNEILGRFSEWERNEIFPPLHPLNLKLMLDELAEVNYIEIRDGKAYPKGS